jgi:hypothetical protein
LLAKHKILNQIDNQEHPFFSTNYSQIEAFDSPIENAAKINNVVSTKQLLIVKAMQEHEELVREYLKSHNMVLPNSSSVSNIVVIANIPSNNTSNNNTNNTSESAMDLDSENSISEQDVDIVLNSNSSNSSQTKKPSQKENTQKLSQLSVEQQFNQIASGKLVLPKRTPITKKKQ